MLGADGLFETGKRIAKTGKLVGAASHPVGARLLAGKRTPRMRDKSILERQAQPLGESRDQFVGYVPLGVARDPAEWACRPRPALIKGFTILPFTPAMPLNQAMIDAKIFAFKDGFSSDSR